MKTTLVRFSVLALALTGFAASTVVSQSQTRPTHVNTPRANFIGGPAPLCMPSTGGRDCGF